MKSDVDKKLEDLDIKKIKLETDVLELSNTLKAQIDDKLNHFDLTKIKLETDVLELSNTLKSDIEAKKTDLELTKDNLQKDVLKNSEVLKSNIDSKLNDLEVTFNTRMDQGFSDLNVKKHELEIDILETLENIKGEIYEKEELFQNNINSKLEIGFDELNKKKESMEKHLLNTELKSKEKVELRLTELEKNLNKRFLDFDSMFTSFKSVVIDEVEDLMKEVSKLVANKESEMNTIITQSKFMLNELKTKGFDISKIHELVDNQIKDLRDNFEDIKVRQEIFSSPREYSLNEYVSNMQKYEKQVNALIINLRGRGFNDSQILDALSSKGHPKFLVMMILENFSRVYN
ncbi:hypothetical protein EOM09_06510 [bacterium]|nr:hypothetical protein [bacterium]